MHDAAGSQRVGPSSSQNPFALPSFPGKPFHSFPANRLSHPDKKLQINEDSIEIHIGRVAASTLPPAQDMD